jgi:hypothetical protein
MAEAAKADEPSAEVAPAQPVASVAPPAGRAAAGLELTAWVADLRAAAATAPPSAAARPLARRWADARAGGWNAQDTRVGGALRIPVWGLTDGFEGDDPQRKYTTESARKRAIVVIPERVDLSKGKVDVLLHFHGRNIGYRERAKEGTVRDVEVDQIEQQLVASDRRMVAVLPQGSRESGPDRLKFDIGGAEDYVTDAIQLALDHLPEARRPANEEVEVGRIVVSGHSGGGSYAIEAADIAQPAQPSVEEWVDAPPLLLFDGVNTARELADLQLALEDWLQEDRRQIAGKPDAAALLARRGVKLRSSWGTGSDAGYQAQNTALVAWLDTWFKAHGTGDAAVDAAWRAQYRVERFAGQHDYLVGTGKAAGAKERDAVPPGVTGGPSTTAGVPKYAGGGNLEAGLRSLHRRADDTARRRPAMPAARVLALQQSIGNRAVGRALGRKPNRKPPPPPPPPPPIHLETPKTRHVDETGTTFMPQSIAFGRFSIFVPAAWLGKYNLRDPASLDDLRVHVFCGAATGTTDDVSLHGLRGASNLTEWITVYVPGTTIPGRDKTRISVATPFTDADLKACLTAVGIKSPIKRLRITGHSRGAITAVAFASATKQKTALERVTLLDEFQVGDPADPKKPYHGKVETLIAAGIPKKSIRGYETQNPAKVHIGGGVDYRPLDSMATIGAVRLIQDAMALDPQVAAAAAATTIVDPKTKKTTTVKQEAQSLTLRARGSLPSKGPAGTETLRTFARTNAATIAAIHTSDLVQFINTQDLTGWGTSIDWRPFAGHEFFVQEIAAELYD